MEPREYAAAVWRRSIWIVAAGVAAAAAAIAVALTSAPSYTATASLFVGVSEVDSSQGFAWGSLLEDQVLPSVVRLGTSAAVLGPVADGLSLDVTPANLAKTVDVTLTEDTSVIVVTARASAPTRAARVADAVAENLAAVAMQVHADAGGTSFLRAEVVGQAREPRFRSSPDLPKAAVLGMGTGLLAGVLLAGLGELARRRIRDEGDVAAVTALPVLAGIPLSARRGPTTSGRTAAVDRLGWLLRSDSPVSDPARLVLLGTTSEGARNLARELESVAGADLRVSPATPSDLQPDDAARARAAAQDGLVVVVDAGRTTRRSLAAAVASAEAAAVPLRGAVIDGVLPIGADWRHRLHAALRGDLPLPRRAVDARPSSTRRTRWLTHSRITATCALFAVGLAQPLPGSVTTAFLTGLVLLPVWIAALPRYRAAVPLGGLAVLALVSGVLLAGWSAAQREFSERAAIEIPLFVLTGLGAIGLLLWARSVLPLPGIGVAYGLGLLVHGVLEAPQSVNAYKFELALPITIVVLSLVSMRRGRLATVVALAALGLANVLNDARSAFGFCIIAAGLVLWQARLVRRVDSSSAVAGVLLLGAAAVGVYLAATELMVAGALGAEVQARTSTQISQTGSLLLGGRPEWTATWSLMQDRPWGYGLGVVPDSHDVAVAKTGFAVTHIPSAEGYLENFMLTDRFELHSVAADLWSALGPAGLAYAILVGALVVVSLGRLLGHREASGLACFVGLVGVWNLAFGTLPSNGIDVAFAVGLLLLAREPHPLPTGDDGEPPHEREFPESPLGTAIPLPSALVHP